MKINVLEPSVYNRIAAGEVVENPASVVKELAENAIDAGGNSVTIRIEEGGIKLIEVEDDGVGIQKEELPKTVLAHATSKISSENDLYSISTLGFRGEALASIAAVSNFTIKTKYYDNEIGAILETNGGETPAIKDIAKNQGTVVTVSKLFYNTPARYKFLKSVKNEENKVTALVSDMILANPQIAFKYYADNKLVYESDGEGLFSAIKAVFPTDISNELLPVIPTDDKKITVSGFIGKPSCVQHNHGMQTVIVNGRVINDQNLSASVQNAYGERLMHRCFPVFTLVILVPFESVDVNVHPNKREVRFENPREVYGAVYNAVKKAIEDFEYAERRSLFLSNSGDIGKNSTKVNVAPINEVAATSDFKLSKGATVLKESPTASTPSLDGKIIMDFNSPNTEINDRVFPKEESAADFLRSLGLPVVDDTSEDGFKNTLINTEIPKEKIPEIIDFEESKTFAEVKKTANYKVIGQLFATYIMVESGDNLIVIDQHAAHERLLYNKLTEEMNGNGVTVQDLLIPYILNCSPSDTETAASLKETFAVLGFDLDAFGSNSIKVSAVPAILSGVDIGAFLSEIIAKNGNSNLSSLAKDYLATAACKAAIKGGDTLNSEQISEFMERFSNGNTPLRCPHGRPTYLVFPKVDLEKMFKRKL